MEFISRILWSFRPVVLWVSEHLTIPASVKKVTGDHYYRWRNKIFKGYVLLSNTRGSGTNLLNPSGIKHGAIYFGSGLKTALNKRVEELTQKGEGDSELAQRLKVFAAREDIKDEICYVFEALKPGFIPNNLVKFLTTKDRIKIMKPIYVTNEERIAAANHALDFLGLPYDFGFKSNNGAKYCFEAIAHSYEAVKDEKLPMVPTVWFGTKVYEAYRSKTFTEDPKRWECVVDSEKEA